MSPNGTACAAEFGRYRGIAEMARLAAGSTRSRMDPMGPGRMEGGCSTLPGRAGISNAFSAAYSNRDLPVDLEQHRQSGIGCHGKYLIQGLGLTGIKYRHSSSHG